MGLRIELPGDLVHDLEQEAVSRHVAVVEMIREALHAWGVSRDAAEAVNNHPRFSPPAEVAESDLWVGACDERAWLHAAPVTSAGIDERRPTLPGPVGAAISRENLVHELSAIRARGVLEDDSLLTIFLNHLREVRW
jgi:hypothetical protein